MAKKANVTGFFDLRQMLTCRFAAGKNQIFKKILIFEKIQIF